VNRYRVGLAKPVHLHVLPAVERAAALIFPDDVISPEARASAVPVEELYDAREQRRLWVATTEISIPVGFAIAVPFEDGAFLLEVAVHPMHQRNGLGKLLVRAAIDWARAEGYPHISLTTFEHLPWNAPFYCRRRSSEA
jgi:GNAT superfamily N-acetyltransferase